ncbi:MAG TPA: hypothetical protein PLW44_18800 [Chitinophagales bacterium]|nr:hypothetical protein [Chitinophagales bacterium]
MQQNENQEQQGYGPLASMGIILAITLVVMGVFIAIKYFVL